MEHTHHLLFFTLFPGGPQSYVELTPAAVVAVALVIITFFVLGLFWLRGSQRGGGQGG
jgi:hypothetical protein